MQPFEDAFDLKCRSTLVGRFVVVVVVVEKVPVACTMYTIVAMHNAPTWVKSLPKGWTRGQPVRTLECMSRGASRQM
jgi:hypothetical protein